MIVFLFCHRDDQLLSKNDTEVMESTKIVQPTSTFIVLITYKVDPHY